MTLMILMIPKSQKSPKILKILMILILRIGIACGCWSLLRPTAGIACVAHTAAFTSGREPSGPSTRHGFDLAF